MITADDIAKEFYPLLYSHQRDYLKERIDAAIAAAVQAEREQARKIEVALRSLIEDIEQFPGAFDADSESVVEARKALNTYMDAQDAAIRARR